MSALVPVVDKLEDVPEQARQFYVQKDGKFHVDLAGAPVGFVPASELALANGKVVEFRDTNIALTKKVNDLEPVVAKFKDIDPEAARIALTEKAELAAKGIKKPTDLDAMRASLLEDIKTSLVKPLTDRLTQVTTAMAEKQKVIDDGILSSTLGDKFIAAGGVPGLKDYIVGKAKDVFEVVDGIVKAKAAQFSADRPGESLGLDEWLTRHTKESPYVFKPSGGGGANPAAGGVGGARTGVTILKDPTPQQLGEAGKDIKAGKVRVEYSEQRSSA